MHLIKQSEEVFRADDNFIRLDRKVLANLQRKVTHTPRKRIRICIHRTGKDFVQEMFIVNSKGAYIRPHKHLNKKESYHIIAGETDILLFDNNGTIVKSIPLGDYRSGKDFYFKLEQPVFHSMIIKTQYLLFVEVTNGPFKKEDTLFAPWSPAQNDIAGIKKYQTSLKQKVNRIKNVS